MVKNSLPRLVLTLLLLAASLPTTAASERGEMIAHPSFTDNGCPRGVAYTDDIVEAALGLKPRMLVRLRNRFGIGHERLCEEAWDSLEGFIRQANNPKRRTDSPDEAQAFRAMQQRDESGDLAPAGLSNALAKRQAMLSVPTPIPRSVLPESAGVTSSTWTWLGPGNIGGRVRAISPHPTTVNEILIGSVSGGVWKTTDGGNSWSALTDFLPNVAIACLVRDPQNANTIFACTGEGFFNSDAVRGLGIFKSTDNGETWAQLASTSPTTAPGFGDWFSVNRLAIHPTNAQIMLAATAGGVYRSADGGASWSKSYGAIAGTTSTRRVLDIRFHPTNGNIAIAGEGRHFNGVATDGAAVAYSADGGLTWTRTVLNTLATLSGNSAGRVEVEISKSNPSIVYALVDMNAGELYKSTNGGVTWTANAPLADNVILKSVLSNQGWYDSALWVAPNDANRIIVGGVTLRMSINGGVTWQDIGSNVHSDHHALVSDPNYASNFTLYGGNDGGVYKATSANTAAPTGSAPLWTNLNRGLGITQFYGGAGKAGGRITGGTQDNGSLYWTGSTNWLKFFGADGGDSAADPTDGEYLYGETQRGGIVRYTRAISAPVSNAGEFICAGLLDADCAFAGGSNVKINFIPPLRLDPNAPNTLLVGADRLWRSANVKASPASAVTWADIKPSLGITSNYISAIAVAPGNSNIIWVGYNGGQLACTTNGTAVAPRWTAFAASPARLVTRITIDDTNNNRVYIANGGYASPNLRLTTQGCTAGATFASIHNQLPAAPIRALTRHPLQANWLYAGTEVGMFTSENGGASWFTNNDGPGTVSVEEIFFLDNSTLIAATHGRGMYSASASAGPGSVQFTASTQAVFESIGSATVTVTRVGGTSGAISVNYATAGGTATSSADFTPQSGTLAWPDGDASSRSFTIPIINDGIPEPSESFSVTLSAPTGGALLGAPATQTITITTEAFPENCQLPAGWTKPNTAQGGWSVATNDANQGVCSLKSDPIGDGQKAQIQFTGNFATGNITFDRKVSSEATFDCFRFYVDGVQQIGGSCDGGSTSIATGASGELAWGPVSVPIAAGTHTLIWSYEKDAFTVAGQDAAWIDAVVLPMALTTTSSSTALTSSQNPAAFGQAVTLTATVSGSAGAAQGSVIFKDSGVTLTGCNGVTMASGSAQCSSGTLSVGSHAITAEYSGSSAYAPSTSAVLTQSISSTPVPGAPTIGIATAGNAQVTIRFTPPQSNGGAEITSYLAVCSPGGFAANAPFSPVTVSNLINNTAYTCTVSANNRNGTGVASAPVTVTPQLSASLAPANVFSRKTHGGTTAFDIDINTGILAISGAVTVEPRSIANGHTIHFRFNNAISGAGTVAVVDANGSAIPATSRAQGNDVIVTIPVIADNKRATITLIGVTGLGGAGNPQAVSMGFLLGDVNGSRSVNASDISAFKTQLGLPISSANFKFDVNTSGSVTAADVSAMKLRSGLVMP